MQRTVLVLFALACISMGCAEVAVEDFLARSPLFYDVSGNSLPDAESVRDGYRFNPDPGDAGSFGVGTWYLFNGGELAAGYPRKTTPEVIRKMWRERDQRNR